MFAPALCPAAALTELQEVDLSGNRLTGTLPSSFARPALTSLVLANNQLNGKQMVWSCSAIMASLIAGTSAGPAFQSKQTLQDAIPKCMQVASFSLAPAAQAKQPGHAGGTTPSAYCMTCTCRAVVTTHNAYRYMATWARAAVQCSTKLAGPGPERQHFVIR